MSTTPTTHYLWAKPDVGSEIDTWGGVLNTIIDEIDEKVFDLEAAATVAAPTGAVMDFLLTAPPTGWTVLAGSIGNGASGASSRANADTLNLFTALWNAFDNTVLPIYDSGGAASSRGASAAADFAANKRLSLVDQPDKFRRTYKAGGASGAIGVPQTDAMQDFKMTFTIGPSNSGGSSTYISTHSDVGSSSTVTLNPEADTAGAPRLASETRPANIAYLTCIKL